jgi:hypothetical protein
VAQHAKYKEPDYSLIDPVISAWADGRGLRIDKDCRGDSVRSIWVANKVQIWFDPPDDEGYLKIHAAERRSDLQSQWGSNLNWRTPISELKEAAEKVWSAAQGWL